MEAAGRIVLDSELPDNWNDNMLEMQLW